MKNISGKARKDNQNTHTSLNNFFCENHYVNELMFKNMVQPARLLIKMYVQKTRGFLSDN